MERVAVHRGRLSSERDRARLREREEAERARVERVLARGPRDVERRRRERPEERRSGQGASEPGTEAARMKDRLAAVVCGVCGGGEVCVDEVFEAGVFRLGQCRRCDHRWTERLSPRFVPRVRRPQTRGSDGGRARFAAGA